MTNKEFKNWFYFYFDKFIKNIYNHIDNNIDYRKFFVYNRTNNVDIHNYFDNLMITRKNASINDKRLIKCIINKYYTNFIFDEVNYIYE